MPHNNYIWPRVHKPIQSEWNTWHQALQTSLNLHANQILPLLLGKWINSIRQRDGFFLEPVGKHLLQWDEGRWYIYGKIPQRQRHWKFHRERWLLLEEPNTEELEWATVTYLRDTITITGMAQTDHKVSTKTPEAQFIQQWNINHHQEGEIDQLVEAIQKGQAVAVSNGLYKDATGAAAWTIEGMMAQHWIMGHDTWNNTGSKYLQKRALWTMGYHVYINTDYPATPNHTRKYHNSMQWEISTEPSSQDNGSSTQLCSLWSHWGDMESMKGTPNWNKIWAC